MTAANIPFHNSNSPPLYNDQGRSIMPDLSRDSGAPPSYEEAINPNAPPPSYDSLFGRVREAQKTSKGVLEFLKNLIIIVLGTLLLSEKSVVGVQLSVESNESIILHAKVPVRLNYLEMWNNRRKSHRSLNLILTTILQMYWSWPVFSRILKVGCTIILGVTIVIPICMIIMGSIYLHDCPQGEYIPVYLLVGGIFGIIKQLLHLSARVRQTEEERQEENLRQSPTQTLLNCFMLGWFIIGSVWVYKEYQPNYDPTYSRYCNKNLYLFAFWLITSVYILLGVIVVCLCSISLATVVFQTNQRDENEGNANRLW